MQRATWKGILKDIIQRNAEFWLYETRLFLELMLDNCSHFLR